MAWAKSASKTRFRSLRVNVLCMKQHCQDARMQAQHLLNQLAFGITDFYAQSCNSAPSAFSMARFAALVGRHFSVGTTGPLSHNLCAL
jgi:hypothetical protein